MFSPPARPRRILPGSQFFSRERDGRRRFERVRFTNEENPAGPRSRQPLLYSRRSTATRRPCETVSRFLSPGSASAFRSRLAHREIFPSSSIMHQCRCHAQGKQAPFVSRQHSGSRERRYVLRAAFNSNILHQPSRVHDSPIDPPDRPDRWLFPVAPPRSGLLLSFWQVQRRGQLNAELSEGERAREQDVVGR